MVQLVVWVVARQSSSLHDVQTTNNTASSNKWKEKEWRIPKEVEYRNRWSGRSPKGKKRYPSTEEGESGTGPLFSVSLVLSFSKDVTVIACGLGLGGIFFSLFIMLLKCSPQALQRLAIPTLCEWILMITNEDIEHRSTDRAHVTIIITCCVLKWMTGAPSWIPSISFKIGKDRCDGEWVLR